MRAWDQGLASAAGTQQPSPGQTMQQVDDGDSRGGSPCPHDLKLIWRRLPRNLITHLETRHAAPPRSPSATVRFPASPLYRSKHPAPQLFSQSRSRAGDKDAVGPTVHVHGRDSPEVFDRSIYSEHQRWKSPNHSQASVTLLLRRGGLARRALLSWLRAKDPERRRAAVFKHHSQPQPTGRPPDFHW